MRERTFARLQRVLRERLRERRERLGLSQAEVAELVGLSTNHVANIENGRPAAATTVLRVSTMLAAFEVGLGAFQNDVVFYDVDRLDDRLGDLERRVELVEVEAADEAARLRSAAAVLANGHGDLSPALFAAA